jgi:putative transposase
MHQPSSRYTRHRFPGELIRHAVWRYDRFLLSSRDGEELLAERGIALT